MKGLKLRKRLTNLLAGIIKTVTFTRKDTFREFVIENTVKSMMIIVFRPFQRVLRKTNWRLTTDRVEAKYDLYAGTDEVNAKYYSEEENQIYCHIDGKIQKMRWVDLEEKKKGEYNRILSQFPFKSILEVGAGEMSTMIPVMKFFGTDKQYYAMDLSLNRVLHGRKKVGERGGHQVEVCKADAASLPYPDNSFDLVYTSHCLEHIPYHYKKVIDEMVRVSRRAVVLFEPTYELDNFAQKVYMRAADYVRGIPGYVKTLKNVSVQNPFLINHSVFLNQTSCHIITKFQQERQTFRYICPICKSDLKNDGSYFFCTKCPRVYFQFDGIPILDAKYSFFVMAQPEATVRVAKKTDAKRIWELRNHPIARQWSKSTKEIPFDEQWFLDKYFGGGKNHCFVLEQDHQVIGYCRLDYRDELSGHEVSVAIDATRQGRGLGTKILTGSIRVFGQKPLFAYTNKANNISTKLFEKSGFTIAGEEEGFLKLILQK